MKKALTLIAAAGLFTFAACGPSAKEKAAAEKLKQDSIATAEAALAAAEADKAKAAADSTAAYAAAEAAKANEAAKAAEEAEAAAKKGGKKKK